MINPVFDREDGSVFDREDATAARPRAAKGAIAKAAQKQLMLAVAAKDVAIRTAKAAGKGQAVVGDLAHDLLVRQRAGCIYSHALLIYSFT
jgi:hypothetical protein